MISKMTLTAGLLAASCLSAHAQQPVYSYDSGPVVAYGIVSNTNHALGTSVGGLVTIPIARSNAPIKSGIITNFSVIFPGGSTGSYVVRIWAANPSHTTCSDNVAYAGDSGASGRASDDAYLITPPFSITPAAPSVTTGDSKTYASNTGVTWDYKNGDTQPTPNVYLCMITGSSPDSTDNNTTLTYMLSGPQN